jgi:REP element-mobilizing transposase RayT
MARPTRIQAVDAWYHVTARGNERRAVFRDDRDRRHFLEVLEEAVGRFGLRLHAYVLLDNHYHLLVETPLANLSTAMQWLGVSYTVWFNRRHRRAGHLFQGRYKAVVVEAESAAWELSRYVHLNPVRVAALGLNKRRQQGLRQGLSGAPDRGQVEQRLKRLRQYRWSSYRAYVGWAGPPRWLTTRVVLAMAGGRSWSERQKAYRQYVEEAVREGLAESPWERVQAQMLLGSAEFVKRVRRLAQGNEREQPALKQLRQRPGWKEAVRAVEQLKGEKWEQFRDRYGDWGRDVALYLARHCCGMKLRQLTELAGGLDYGSVSNTVQRLARQAKREKKLSRFLEQAKATLMNNEM